jgi:hypothetical protein
MPKLTKLSALALVAVFAVACSDSPTDPVTGAPAPAFNQGGQGQGAQFVDNPFAGINHTDPDGDFCRSRVDPPRDDINDFIRTNPNGSRFLHIADHPATVTVITAAGVVWRGTGKLNINVRLGNPQFQYQSTAVVGDAAGNTMRAVCKFVRGPNGKVGVNEVSLH